MENPIAPNPSAPEPEGGFLDDLPRFGMALVAIARDGALPAILAFLPLTLLGTLLFAVAFVAFLLCVTIPFAFVAACVGAAAFSAGPYAAFMMVAEGRPPTFSTLFGRAFDRLFHLSLLYFLIALVATAVQALAMGAMMVLSGPTGGAMAIQALAIATLVLLSARWLTLAQALAFTEQRPRLWPDFAKADALARGHLGILIPAAAAPWIFPFVAKPSVAGVEAGRELLGQANAQAIQSTVSLVAFLLGFFVGPLFGAAAWAVVTRSPVVRGQGWSSEDVHSEPERK